MDLQQRWEKLQGKLKEKKISALVIINIGNNNFANQYYISGFTGSDGIVIFGPQHRILITDSRYYEQAKKGVPNFRIILQGNSATETLAMMLKKDSISHLGVEEEHISYTFYRELKRKLFFLRLVPIKGWVENLRAIKEEKEIWILRRAARIVDETFGKILSILAPGRTEKEIAWEIETNLRQRGAEKSAFDTIVASGVRSSLPHGVATDKKIRAGNIVKMDFGAQVDGYHSDLTRTVVLGKSNRRFQKIYQVVKEAQERAISRMRPGLKLSDVDAIARGYIRAQGYDKYFLHGLGHGVGLSVHELPALSEKAKGKLEAGMVVTVEPGIYIPGWGGVRIEDMVLIGKNGAEVLTHSPKELVEV